MFEALRDAHARLGALADDLELMLQGDRPPAADVLGTKRMQISTAVRDYLMLEDKLLVTPLRGRQTAEADEVVAHFTTGLARLRIAYSQHIADWPSARVLTAWDRYRRATRKLLAALREMIHRKNTVLLPLAAKVLSAKAA